jgi:hypothetical protein
LKTDFEREFKVVFPTDEHKIEVLCEGKVIKSIEANIASEVLFAALPLKTYELLIQMME